MDRWWYVRLAVVLTAVIAGWLVLWPSLTGLVPGWLEAPALVSENIERRISPGLDIRGGLRLMYTVDVDEAVRSRRDARREQLLERLGEKLGILESGSTPDREALERVRARVNVFSVRDDIRSIRAEFEDPADVAQLDRDLVRSFGDMRETGRTSTTVTLALTEESLENLAEVSVDQARETISNRIDEYGLREAAVMSRERDIIVEIPGDDDAAFDRIREIISRTARLDFKIVDDDSGYIDTIRNLPDGFERSVDGGDWLGAPSSFIFTSGAGPCPEGIERPDSGTPEAPLCSARQRLSQWVRGLIDAGEVPDDRQLLVGRYEIDETGQTEAWRTYLLHARAEVTGGELEDAQVGIDPQDNKPYVGFQMNRRGAQAMERLTTSNLRRRMAIVLDDRVESAPVIQGRISNRGQITLGGFRDYNELLNEANELVIVLRAGALPAPIQAQNEQRIGPTLGRDSVIRGAEGAAVGILLVLLFMAIYYQVAGLVADVMVVLNVMFVIAILAAFEATLTLPGVAGIALTVGMAVDANVLITERIREELRMGKSARAAVEQGFRRSFWSIVDAQVTTFIAGVVLFQYGTGPIKGFAVTLMIGILTSLFTGIFCSKVVFDWIVRGLKVERLRVG